MALQKKNPALPVPALADEIPAAPIPEASQPAPAERGLTGLDLENTTTSLLQKLDQAWQDEATFISRHSHKPYLTGLKNIPLRPFRPPEVVIALLSDVSGGKSSFMNVGLCGYPIIPVARTTTSICAVEARRTDLEREERIEVCYLTPNKKALESKPVHTFRKQVLAQPIFQKLYEYAQFLVAKSILDVDDTLIFFRDKNGRIDLRPNCWRHCMVLLMIVLDAYVHQDQQDDPDLHADYKEANQLRNELLTLIGLPGCAHQDYGLRLYWHSERIPPNAVLVDLPGTGSATIATAGQLGHTQLVTHYLGRASSVICFFDEAGTLGAEVRNLLGIFIKASHLKGSSSARLTFVLNRADRIDGNKPGQPDAADRSIRTTINSFRQSFPLSAHYPIYALSTFNGERFLCQSGISVRNLHHANEYAVEYQRFNRRRPPEEQIAPEDELEEIQQERFTRAYPYQTEAGAEYGSIDFPSFVDALITDYVGRIQFLLSAECFRDHMDSVKNIADAIASEQSMLHIILDYKPELSDAIIGAMQDGMGEATNDLDGKFQALNVELGKMATDATKKIRPIAAQFQQDYADLNNSINQRFQNTVAALRRQPNGTIPVDGNLAGSNEIGIENRQKLSDLFDNIAVMDFISFFQPSLTMLDNEFDLERKTYQNSVDQICAAILEFPRQMLEKMDSAFSRKLEEKRLENVPDLENALAIAQTATERLLQTACENYAKELRRDARIDNLITETADNIQAGLMSVLAPYTTSSYRNDVLKRICKHRLVRANIIKENDLSKLLNEHFIGNFQDKMTGVLDLFLKDRNSLLGQHAYLFRLQDTLITLAMDYMSSKTLGELQSQAFSAMNVTDGIIQDPQILDKWRNVLAAASADIQDFFADGTACACLEETASLISGTGWAKDTVGNACTAAAQAREHAALLLDRGE